MSCPNHLQFWVSGFVEQEKQFIVVLLCEQVVGQKHHQRLVLCYLLWVTLKKLETVVNEDLIDFLALKKTVSILLIVPLNSVVGVLTFYMRYCASMVKP